MGRKDWGMVVSREELMPLINHVFSKGERFTVKYPFFDLQLASFQTVTNGFRTVYVVDKDAFMRARKGHMPKGHFFEFDLPVYNDVKDAMVLAGMIRYPNMDHLLATLSDIIGEERRRTKLTFIGIDTNIAYLRFFTRNFPLRVEGDVFMAEDYRYVVSDIVRREIDEAIKEKYKGEYIRKMSEKLANPYLLDGFFNAPTRTSRRAKDANVEIYTILSRFGGMKAPSQDYSTDKEERDILIARSYQAFQRDENADVILFTADEDMIDHAISADLDYMFVKYPHSMELNGNVEGVHLCNLLYTLGVRLGAASVPEFHVDIVGEWKGKATEDYHGESVMVRIGDRDLWESFSRSVRIARKVRDVLGHQYKGGRHYGASLGS